jgi:phage shock protein PspC (stress-responsive transcriptional regulator)
MKQLFLSDTDKTFCGVCGGIAEYFGIDSTIVRLGWVLLSIFSAAFPGIIAYILACMIIPKRNF